jgi:hypothetical protein
MVGLFAPDAVSPIDPSEDTPVSVSFLVMRTCSAYVPGQILIVDPAGTEFTAVWIDE